MSLKFTYRLFRPLVANHIINARSHSLKFSGCPISVMKTTDLMLSYGYRNQFQRLEWVMSKRYSNLNETTEDGKFNIQNADRAFSVINASLKSYGRVSKMMVESALHYNSYTKNKGQYAMHILLLLRCCGKKMYDEPACVRMQVLKNVWENLINSGITDSFEHYNALLHVYNENAFKFSPDDILKEMSENGIKGLTYEILTKLMLRYSEDGDLDGANKILEKMKDYDISVGKETFDALIMAHAQTGDMDNVNDMMEMMSAENYSVNNKTYYNIVNGLAKRGDAPGLNKVFKKCSENKIEFTDKEILDFIHTLAICEHDALIEPLIGKLRLGVEYHKECINTILQLTCCNRTDIAFRLLQTLHVPVSIKGVKLGIGIFFLKQIIKMETPFEELCYYCDQLLSNNIHPYAYEMAFKLLLQNSSENVPQAFEMLHKMKDKQIEVKDHYFWPILCAAKKAGNKEIFYKTLKFLSDSNILNVFTMKRFGLDLMLPVSDEKLLIEELEERGVDLPMVISAFVEHYLYIRDAKYAADLCMSYNVPIDSYVHTNLIKCLCEINCREEALTILEHMLDQSHFKDMAKFEAFRTYGTFAFIMGYTKELQYRRMNMSHLVDILTDMKVKGLGLPREAIDDISHIIGVRMSDSVHQLVTDLIKLQQTKATAVT